MFLDMNTSAARLTTQSLETNPRDFERDLPLAGTSNLLALGAELQACVEHPAQVSIGAFAALIDRLQGEFKLVCGDDELYQAPEDDYAVLFLDRQTRELSQHEIGQIEAALTGC
jgi:hypothetical protein